MVIPILITPLDFLVQDIVAFSFIQSDVINFNGLHHEPTSVKTNLPGLVVFKDDIIGISDCRGGTLTDVLAGGFGRSRPDKPRVQFMQALLFLQSESIQPLNHTQIELHALGKRRIINPVGNDGHRPQNCGIQFSENIGRPVGVYRENKEETVRLIYCINNLLGIISVVNVPWGDETMALPRAFDLLHQGFGHRLVLCGIGNKQRSHRIIFGNV